MYPTVLIGIDGGTFSIFDRLMAEGDMPNLRRLIDEGVRSELLSTPQPLTPPAWTTLMTGRTPGHHGIFDFIWAEERAGQVYFTLNSFRDIRVETIWSIVDRHGGSVSSLNFPLLAPPPAVRGTIVPGLLSWRHVRRNVQPPERYHELRELPGFDVKSIAWDFEREKRATKIIPREERAEWIDFHIRRENHWFEIFRHLTVKHPADLTAVLLDGTDKLFHICWDDLDLDGSDAPRSSEQERHRGLALEYFRRLDAFLGEVMDGVGAQARIFVASDHGFGPTRHVFRINKWLEQKGYLRWGESGDLSAEERERIDKMVQGHFVHVDWDGTLAYAQSSAANGIHIRVARAAGESGVRPEDYAQFRARLMAELLEAQDPETGIRVVQKVLTREEAFGGDANERCADLTVILHDHGFVSTLNQDPVFWSRPDVAGTHRPEGIFLARGPGIRRGETLPLQSILDVAPTLLYSLGVAIPSDFEGRVMTDVFDPSLLREQPVKFGSPTVSPRRSAPGDAGDATGLDEPQDELVIERLRALGYVE